MVEISEHKVEETYGTKESRSNKKAASGRGLAHELKALMLKCAVVIVALIILLGYIFGMTRNLSLNMQPSFQDGDLVFYYRIVQGYAADDVVVIHHKNQALLERIAAVSGDTVDITEDGLMINGSLVQEQHAFGETTQFEEGVTFPLTVPAGKVFLLGDNRPHATDSRIFGCIDVQDIDGRVIGIFRRRNF